QLPAHRTRREAGSISIPPPLARAPRAQVLDLAALRREPPAPLGLQAAEQLPDAVRVGEPGVSPQRRRPSRPAAVTDQPGGIAGRGPIDVDHSTVTCRTEDPMRWSDRTPSLST